MKTPSLAAMVALAALVAAAPASAQTVDRGSTTFELSRSAASALKKSGVTVTAGRPARRIGTAVTLPVARGILSGGRYLEHSGTLSFRRHAGGKTRRIVFRDLRTTLGTTVSVSGAAGGKRVALLTLSARRPSVNTAEGTAVLPATKATLTTRAATLVRRALRLERLSRALGTVNVNAALRGRTPATGGGTTTPGTGGGTTTPGGTTPAPGGTPSNTKGFVEPPVATRPADAVDVGSASFDFHVRPSWLSYLASGDGASDGTIVADGATESGASGPDDWNRSFQFPHTGPSWKTPADAAGLYFGGSLTFSYPSHNIEIVLRNPEIELHGPSSRMIFRVDGSAITAQSRDKRAALFDLNLAAANVSTTLTTRTYANVPVTVTADAADAVFAGMYRAGEDYGTMTVTLPR